MAVKEVVSLFKETFPDLEIDSLKRVGEWYIFTIGNAPKDTIRGEEIAIDPFIGYNTKTNEWDRVSPPMLGIARFVNAPSIPFE